MRPSETPCFANVKAVARPIPFPAPVMIAIFPCNEIVHLSLKMVNAHFTICLKTKENRMLASKLRTRSAHEKPGTFAKKTVSFMKFSRSFKCHLQEKGT